VTIAETVDDCQFAFDVWSRGRACAASDIVASPGNKVWGVVYDVPDFLMAREVVPKLYLDRFGVESRLGVENRIPSQFFRSPTSFGVVHLSSDSQHGGYRSQPLR
jgi:hypothetical protein